MHLVKQAMKMARLAFKGASNPSTVVLRSGA